ncbi:MAG: SH3 domain-containing protein [Candidatus Tectomicrobia bacterium]|uniref:SH3 domain-containing protein n=1 Tax=Tectimicrobiota bacterium TaxID=2528274 RepID=A0A932FVJ2_UNCTE|nr:SH3 domain-containing protein [Candidatus Tectomicrobia bacterium]
MRIVMLLLIWLSVVQAAVCLAGTTSIKVPGAHIRSGPGSNYRILWRADQFYPLEVLSRNGNWYRVKDFKGKVGWVHQEQTSDTPTVVVKARWADVRSGPGSHYPLRLTAERGSAFHCIQEVGHWVQVGYVYGEMGWIDRKLLWGGRPGEQP